MASSALMDAPRRYTNVRNYKRTLVTLKRTVFAAQARPYERSLSGGSAQGGSSKLTGMMGAVGVKRRLRGEEACTCTARYYS